MFDYSFVPSGNHRPLVFIGGSIGEALLLAAITLAPLLFVETLPNRGLFNVMMLPSVPIAPPAPAPAMVAKRAPRVRPTQIFNPKGLVSPVVIPRAVATIEDAPVIDVNQVVGGVPGGIPAVAAVGAGAFSGALSLAPPPPLPLPKAVAATPPPAPAAPRQVNLGGEVEAAMLSHMTPPVYPLLARTGRITGKVVLLAIIGTDGKVKNLSVVSGHPLLVDAALKAVESWTYRPTILDGAPVEVITHIEVRFNLGK